MDKQKIVCEMITNWSKKVTKQNVQGINHVQLEHYHD